MPDNITELKQPEKSNSEMLMAQLLEHRANLDSKIDIIDSVMDKVKANPSIADVLREISVLNGR